MGKPFSRTNSTSDPLQIAVPVPRFVVRVAKCQPASDPTQPATWGQFAESNVLKVDRLYFGSTLGGPSSAKLRLSIGVPVTSPGTLPEQADPLGHGDRVIVSLRDPAGNAADEPRWAGYCVGGEITVDAGHEGIAYRLVGPEWIWGDSGRDGSNNPVVGQVRITASSDDATEGGSTADLDRGDLFTARAYPAVFNAGGRKNMSSNTADLSAGGGGSSGGSGSGSGGADMTCHVFETPDRKRAGQDAADSWTMLQAVKFLLAWYNDESATGIPMPDLSSAQMDDAKVLPETAVDGLGLWGALRRAMSPDWQLYVDPVPSAADTWGGFKVGFYQRGQGDPANFTLNPPGTRIANAVASVVRLQANKDTAKCVNQITVLGSAVRHIQLQYHGDKTPTLGESDKPLSLQHGWGQTEGKLSDWAATSPTSNLPAVDLGTIAAAGNSNTSSGSSGGGGSGVDPQDWTDKYTTKGKLHPQYSHVFRLFIWNEAGEWTSDDEGQAGSPVYGKNSTPFDWYAPDLTGIADATGFGENAGSYCRTRRRLLDTAYPDATSDVDGWRRVPPTLYISGMSDKSGSTKQGPWVRFPNQYFRVDHERGAVWVTCPDIAAWCPLVTAPDPEEPTVYDGRTFATLLHTGCLRLMLECSIECDAGLQALADRQGSAGSPLVRSAYVRSERSFTQSLEATANVASPSGLSAEPVDQSTDAMEQAERFRRAGERQQSHASVVTCPDWAEQPIGSVIAGTGGRRINLQTGANNSGPGAQIVGFSILPGDLKYEYVTESRASELGAQHLRRPKGHRHGHHHAAGVPHVGQANALAGTAAEVYGPGGDGGPGMA